MKKMIITASAVLCTAGTVFGLSMQKPEFIQRAGRTIIHMQNDVGKCGTFGIEPNQNAQQILSAYEGLANLTIIAMHVYGDGAPAGESPKMGETQVFSPYKTRFGGKGHWDIDVYCYIDMDASVAEQVAFKNLGVGPAVGGGGGAIVNVNIGGGSAGGAGGGPAGSGARSIAGQRTTLPAGWVSKPIGCDKIFDLTYGSSGRFCPSVQESYDPNFNLETD